MRPGRSRATSPRNRSGNGPPPPIRPLKNLQTVDARERAFLEAAERGDKATVQECLEGEEPVNVNCTDLLGRTAIEMAVDNENVEIVEIMLRQPGVMIGNALLYAIREGVYKIVEMLIDHPSITADMLGEGWSSSQQMENFEYPSDVSPVMLAAHLNQFEILQLLLSRGATIRKPHSLACACESCERGKLVDSLHHSLHRIHTYTALASPAWICLTSSDPVLTAFRLSWELQKLSNREHEFKEVYWRLSEQCKTFACDLLSQCRSTEEVIAVLNKEATDEPEDIWGSKLSLARLKLAIKYEQKQFVAHPHCQQLLTSIWYEGFPGRRERGSILNVFVCLLLMAIWPVLAVCYIAMPRSRIGRIVRSPFMKFLYYSTSFGCFLLLLTLATFEGQSEDVDGAAERGPAPTAVETLIAIWVFGMVWSEVKQLWDEGFVKYIRQWWNWLDFIMMSLYLSTFSLRVAAYYSYKLSGSAPHPRNMWRSDEPTLIAEGLFAVANVFSFARIIYLFQTNPYLGPLQISLGCMLVDIAKFFVIFLLVLSSFAIGMKKLYWWYKPEWKGNDGQFAFSSIFDSYTTLLWSLFSITDTAATQLDRTGAAFTQWVGRAMFIAYHVTSIIVLLNMLIAMMSSTFQQITDHSDLEWKFHRTKLYMSYFDEGSSLPAPFNMVITPKSAYYVARAALTAFRGQSQWTTRSKRATIKVAHGHDDHTRHWHTFSLQRPGYDKHKRQLDELSQHKLTYQGIMSRLVSRYIHKTKKEMKMDSVNEDDLLEIKQDISSLRYELREDRRKEIARSSSHIDGVKKEILRTLSVSGSKRAYDGDVDDPSRTPSVSEYDECEQTTFRRAPSVSGYSLRRRPASVWDLECVKKEITDTMTERVAARVIQALRESTVVSSANDNGGMVLHV